jgi:hypothetical protein
MQVSPLIRIAMSSAQASKISSGQASDLRRYDRRYADCSPALRTRLPVWTNRRAETVVKLVVYTVSSSVMSCPPEKKKPQRLTGISDTDAKASR